MNKAEESTQNIEKETTMNRKILQSMKIRETTMNREILKCVLMLAMFVAGSGGCVLSATPPVEVRVGEGEPKAPAAAITEADARRIALAKATELFPTWQAHHKAKYGDVIRNARLTDGIWTVEFSADNGRTGWGATIRIDAQTGKVLSAAMHDGA